MYLSRALLHDHPYPARGMLVAGGNPLLTFPGSSLLRKAFETLVDFSEKDKSRLPHNPGYR
jgi:hypothetical protein